MNKIYYKQTIDAMHKQTLLNLYQEVSLPILKRALRLIKETSFVFLTQIIKTDGFMLV